jgi:hypothetical protein
MDVDLFVPRRAGRFDYGPARAVCNRCPVRRACLEDALAYEAGLATKGGKASYMRHGMFGGTTPAERHSMHWLWELRSARRNVCSGMMKGAKSGAGDASTSRHRDRELSRSPR